LLRLQTKHIHGGEKVSQIYKRPRKNIVHPPPPLHPHTTAATRQCCPWRAWWVERWGDRWGGGWTREPHALASSSVSRFEATSTIRPFLGIKVCFFAGKKKKVFHLCRFFSAKSREISLVFRRNFVFKFNVVFFFSTSLLISELVFLWFSVFADLEEET